MNLSKTEKGLIRFMDKMEIVDCHEHLAPEEERLKTDVDVFTLFSHYTRHDLFRAGMDEKDYNSLYNQDIPIEKRWKTFSPFWKDIRYTSYSRAVLISLKKFYGFDDINEKNYLHISEKMKEFNKPGIYEKILRETCGIRTCLTQCGKTNLGTGLLTPVMPLNWNYDNREELLHPPFAPGSETKSLDDYILAIEKYILKVKKEGAVGLKARSMPYTEPDREEASRLFNKIVSGEVSFPARIWPFFPGPIPLKSYIIDRAIEFAGKNNLVIAVHTGYWGDFRDLHPLHMIPFLIKYPNIRFDIYHLGYPWVRDTLMLAKGFSNVWLNFCWTHIISQKFAMDGLDEAIDLIPVNKILGFGGDYRASGMEKVYGHLTMAKEDMAKVLARRLENGTLNEEQAEYMIRKWLWNNPVELYNLDLKES